MLLLEGVEIIDNMEEIKGCTWEEIKSGSKSLAESYLRGDDPCVGEIPRNEVMLVDKDFAFYVPYIPLVITPIVLDDK